MKKLTINKKDLLIAIIVELKEARDKAAQAADAAKATATDSENVAENKYDTLGLEAAYLAHGQSDRILQLEEDIRTFEEMEIKGSSKVELGALIELEDDTGETSVVFLAPSAGGFKVSHDGLSIQVITPAAPLGKLLMGTEIDDEVNLELGRETRSFLVVSIA